MDCRVGRVYGRCRHHGSLDVPIYGQGGRLARYLYAANAFCRERPRINRHDGHGGIFAVWTFFASNVRLQTLQGVFPMRLRWNFHRLMLGQSLGFYQDEFAGRVSAKVMQTALALRDVVMTVCRYGCVCAGVLHHFRRDFVLI